MATIQERLQMKREPLDKWSTREQLCLAVARMNDQNLTSVSRALKPFAEPNRPSDWFHQKNCAAQYGALLANVETPKRKKRTGGVEVFETPAECVVRRLLADRKAELTELLAEERTEYLQIQKDLALIHSGKATEEQIEMWCKQIDEEEHRTEDEAAAHSQWLRERELRKQEIERSWRPITPIGSQLPIQKRKHSDSTENMEKIDEPVTSKPAQSPLLTSLLKSPSPVVISTASSVKSAITTSPTIASLLNSQATVTVSPGIQQLVTSAIGVNKSESQPAEILDEEHFSGIKIDDLAQSILVQEDGSLPEIKTDVDGLISDLIDNAQDIVDDPEQHLQIDGNGDININLELDELEEEEATVQQEEKELGQTVEESNTTKTTVDPFEFREEVEVFEPAKKFQPEPPPLTEPLPAVKEEPPTEELLFNELEVKSGPIKRDYSRKNRTKDDKEPPLIDMTFLELPPKDEDTVEPVPPPVAVIPVVDTEVKAPLINKIRLTIENERSNSSWTTEDDEAGTTTRSKRRLSTTPSDSVPNSPASSVILTALDSGDDRDYKNWKKSMMLVYNRLATNKYASVFLKPITDDQAPGYHNVIYRPMDLSTIRKNVENGVIRTTQEFQRDVMLMLNNAIMFNKTNTTIFNMAKQMQSDCLQQIQILVLAQAQSKVGTPTRRETRTSESSRGTDSGSSRKRFTDDVLKSGKKRKDD